MKDAGSCDVVTELAADTRSVIHSLSSGYKPTRQSSRNDSIAPNGYKRADKIQYGKFQSSSSSSSNHHIKRQLNTFLFAHWPRRLVTFIYRRCRNTLTYT